MKSKLLLLLVMFGSVCVQAETCSDFFYYKSIRFWDTQKLIQKRSDLSFLLSLAEMNVRFSKGAVWALYRKSEALKQNAELSQKDALIAMQELNDIIVRSLEIMARHEAHVANLQKDLRYLDSLIQK